MSDRAAVDAGLLPVPTVLARIRIALADALTAAGREPERATTLRAEAKPQP